MTVPFIFGFPPSLLLCLLPGHLLSSHLLFSSVSFVHFGHAAPYSLSACPFPLARRRPSVFISSFHSISSVRNRIGSLPVCLSALWAASATHPLSLFLVLSPCLFSLFLPLAFPPRPPFASLSPLCHSVNPIRKTAFFSFQHLIPVKSKINAFLQYPFPSLPYF